MRENVVKRKVSPNFVCLYLYTMDSTSGIDYGKLDMIKYETYPKGLKAIEVRNSAKINEKHEKTKHQ